MLVKKLAEMQIDFKGKHYIFRDEGKAISWIEHGEGLD